jgi:hypothetical protein
MRETVSTPEQDAGKTSLDLIWGGEAIAKVIGRSVRTTFYLLESGHLPATKCGRYWCTSRAGLRKHFAAAMAEGIADEGSAQALKTREAV